MKFLIHFWHLKLKQKTLFDGTPFECTITINTFSSKGTYKTLCNRLPINQSEGINQKDIQCNGMTAFYDAILQTLDLEFPEETDKIHDFIIIVFLTRWN